jgi:hypothetical protein
MAGVLEALAKCAQAFREPVGRYATEEPDHRHRPLLRARRERPSHGHTAPLHLSPLLVCIPGAAGCASEKHTADSVQIYLRIPPYEDRAPCSLGKVAHFNPEMGVILAPIRQPDGRDATLADCLTALGNRRRNGCFCALKRPSASPPEGPLSEVLRKRVCVVPAPQPMTHSEPTAPLRKGMRLHVFRDQHDGQSAANRLGTCGHR